MAKIRVLIPARTVEVDTEEWNRRYGCGSDASSVRKDVKAYFDLDNSLPGMRYMVRVVK